MFEKFIDSIGETFEEIYDEIECVYDETGDFIEDFLDWLFE